MKKIFLTTSIILASTSGIAETTNYLTKNPNSNVPIQQKVSGIYLDGNLGWGKIDISSNQYIDPYTDQSPSNFNNNDLAWSADLGYQFNNYMAIEAGYISFGESQANTSIYNTPISVTDTYGGFDTMIKIIAPITPTFNLYTKLGTADLHDSFNSSSILISNTGSVWTVLVGIGASYNVTKNFSLNVQDIYSFENTYQFNGTNIEMPGMNALLGGLSYKFIF